MTFRTLPLIALAFLIACESSLPSASSVDRSLDLSKEGVIFLDGFEPAPPGSGKTSRLRTTSHPNIVMERQQAVIRSGDTAYHLRGGDLTDGDADIYNQPKALPFGGLEVWVGGAFYFESFPNQTLTRPVWLMATVPTDGERGADDKPVAAIDGQGRLVLKGSNSAALSVMDVSLETGRWYYLVLHGRNGVGETQDLYLYDATTRELLGTTSLVLDVTGTFRNRITKWGFGTSQDSSGLEYYLDDVYHARGAVNPGPLSAGAWR